MNAVIESKSVTKDGISLCCAYGYDKANPDQVKAIVNGCGPGGWKVDLVPDAMYGLYVGEGCDIHDWDYAHGECIDEKDRADRTLRNNLLRLVEARTSKSWLAQKILLPLRRRLCQIYYEAVSKFGGPAFWDGKSRC